MILLGLGEGPFRLLGLAEAQDNGPFIGKVPLGQDVKSIRVSPLCQKGAMSGAGGST